MKKDFKDKLIEIMEKYDIKHPLRGPKYENPSFFK